ncbi:hypothetical protein BC629DRAFT_1593211 [Irpex lacteus]|nr:hypothetical protein BC629DRAFT_1593211 [Irpex lacteus]
MMEGIDTNWCLGCDSHYSSTEAEPYCSAECFHKHQQEAGASYPLYRSQVPPSPQPIPVHHHHSPRRHYLSRTPSSSSFHSESFSELNLDASHRPSPAYPYAASPSHSHASIHSAGSSSSVFAWLGKGAEGVPAWAATIPYGCDPEDPSSSTSSPRHSRRSSASSMTPPSRPRTRTSMTCSNHSGCCSLRPAALDISSRKPAPPRLDRLSNVSHVEHTTSHGTSVVNVSSPPTPTMPSKSMATVTPYTSLPSLARSSASVSVTSIVTPGSLLQAGSRPVTPPESEHGDDDFEVVEEKVRHELAGVEQKQKKSKASGLFNNIAQSIKAWAASNEFAESQLGVNGRQRAALQQARVTNNKTVAAPQQQSQPRQAQDTVRPSYLNRQLKEPVAFIHDEELAYGVGSNVRMGRGLVSASKVIEGEKSRVKKGERYPVLPMQPFSLHGRL